MTGDWRLTHRRFNPLRRDWVLVSPQRTDRPWQGQIERVAIDDVPRYDADCYLCPGNRRHNGASNPQYASTFAFDNDFAALVPERPVTSNEHPVTSNEQPATSLFLSAEERGICRVVCFSPRHDLTLARMELTAVRSVVDLWIGECAQLAAVP